MPVPANSVELPAHRAAAAFVMPFAGDKNTVHEQSPAKTEIQKLQIYGMPVELEKHGLALTCDTASVDIRKNARPVDVHLQEVRNVIKGRFRFSRQLTKLV